MIVEKHYLIHGQYETYRVRPNPESDRPASESGVVVDWRDPEVKAKWRGDIFIAGDSALAVAEAIQELVAEGKE